MEKNEIRKNISDKKKQYSENELKTLSSGVMERLEENVVFRCARTVLMYYSLPDEVHTHDFIEKWSREKTILLPVVNGDDMELKVYSGKECMQKGSYNIYEPQGKFIRVRNVCRKEATTYTNRKEKLLRIWFQ